MFGTLEEVIAQDQVSVMNQWTRNNSRIERKNEPKKGNRKRNVNLSMTCDI